MRKFNIHAVCVPKKHYMVDITNKLQQIKKLVDQQEYFIINRGRQYGKTTTLFALQKYLSDEYAVISLSFEGIGDDVFRTESEFCIEFLNQIQDRLELSGFPLEEQKKWKNGDVKSFATLSRHIREVCRHSDKKYVLLIDEVDKSSNNIVFLNFLGKLRDKYIARNRDEDFTFHSVILAGVYDIKNIKLKLVQEGLHEQKASETTINNSPWNIAADFKVDMSFSVSEIKTMLVDYESENSIGMDMDGIATEIHNYTNGYPVLVTTICKLIDEELEKDWTVKGVRKAVKMILVKESPLFDSLIKNLTGNEELFTLTQRLIMEDLRWRYNIYDQSINLGVRYGFLTNINSRVAISNKIFEIVLTNYFISYDERKQAIEKPSVSANETGIITSAGFNMEVCLERFANYYHLYFNDKDEKFIERQANKLLLMFLSSVVNGNGFVYIESGLADGRSMDIIVTYLGTQFIIETKIWHGEKLHDDAYTQLEGYMEKLSLSVGYLLTYNFNKTKKTHQKWIERVDGRKIFDVMV